MTFLILGGSSVRARAERSTSAPVSGSVAREAIKGGYNLITPDELEREFRKDHRSLLLVDTRQDWAYQMEHIAGAVNLPISPTREYQYSPSARSEMRRVLGPGLDKKIVFY